MPKIHVLSEILASQVAAGEVVERPASVVKELVENSIDAGSSHIVIEIQKGGSALIRVTDNGCGMSKDDALLSLERHATSKLKSSDQLMNIGTLGFRGEAVPSIASVSRFRLASQEAHSVEGTEILVDGGTTKEVKSAGLSTGTVIEAKQIFFNVPARRKFLKAETTESAHVEHQVKLHALSAPQVRFTYRKDGKQVFDLPATDDRRIRISGIMGQSIASSLIEIPHHEQRGMEVSGYLLPAEFSRKGKRQQYIFLNGRPVEDPAISRALRDGFRGAVAEGMHPSAWLWIDMHPSMVDVNVHPAKREVRFQYPHEVRFLVTQATELALTEKDTRKSEPKIISKLTGTSTPVRSMVSKNQEATEKEITHSSEGSKNPFTKSNKVWKPEITEQQEELVPDKPPEPEKSTPTFKVLAILHEKYILMQGEEGIVVLDPKAARQRIIYEEVMQKQGEVNSQGILIPEVIELDAHDFDIMQRNAGHFHDAGIQMEIFGANSFQISGLPEFLQLDSPREFITSLIDELIATQETKKGKSIAYELFAHKIAQNSAKYEPVKLNRVEALLEQLFKCDLPYCDPAGEPTLIQIAIQELDKKFGKTR